VKILLAITTWKGAGQNNMERIAPPEIIYLQELKLIVVNGQDF
jgi:hypothetical protein